MVVENIHQVAIRKWIWASLQITEVVNLNGDAGYILNNMIAKYSLYSDTYRISKLALRALVKQNIDLNVVHFRSRFYGKDKPYMYEHTIPAIVIRLELLKSNKSEEVVNEILTLSGDVVVIKRIENELLKKAKLNSSMPDGWKFGDDQYARYKEAGIDISDKYLKVKGAVYR